MKKIFILCFIFLIIFINTPKVFGFTFNWEMKNLTTGVVLKGGGATMIECSLDRSAKITSSNLTTEMLKQWVNTKGCSETGADFYFFAWQDSTTLLKYEEASANKEECEKKVASNKYPDASECYTPSQQLEINKFNDVKPIRNQNENVFKSDYMLLAPIGDLKAVTPDNQNNTECKINSFFQAGIGCYLNILLMIAIGLCGALAVIMIVVRGVQYMGDESVFGKTEAKSHIMAAVLGLLLALGAYALLNTINPKLLGKGGPLTFNQVKVELDFDEDKNYTPEEADAIIKNAKNLGTSTGAGPISDPKIVNKIIPSLEKSDGGEKKIGVVIHRTAGTTAQSAYATWINGGGATGAHFIITEKGEIWQTASINRKTNSIMGGTRGGKPITEEPYTNSNTISIEVVGQCYIDRAPNGNTCAKGTTTRPEADRSLKRTVWSNATSAQKIATADLINILRTKGVGTKILAHGDISSNKTYNEGRDVVNLVK